MKQELQLFNAILKKGEKKGQLNTRKKRIKFIFRSILLFKLMIRLGNFILNHKYLKEKVYSYPILLSKLHRPYLIKNMKKQEKLKAIIDTYQIIDKCFSNCFLKELYLNKQVVLAEFNGKNESTYYIVLGLYPEYDKEGEINLKFLDKDKNTLATITFSLFKSKSSKLILFIGGIQGAKRGIGKDYIRDVTKSLYGIFPKKILIEVLYMLEELLNIDFEKYSVGNKTHVYRAQRYIRKRTILSDYDSFLFSLGAEKIKNDIWKLPEKLIKKELDTIPSKKRSQHIKKIQLLSDIEKELKKRIDFFN